MAKIETWWTMADVCETYGVSKGTVYAWVRRGELVAHRFGREWRFNEKNVRAFEETRVVKPKARA